MDFFNILSCEKLVPVVVIKNFDDIKPTFAALNDCGIIIAEVCFRTDYALKSIEFVKETYPKMIIGAGTIINDIQAKEAIAAGANFIVSPGFSKAVFDVCKNSNIPYIPGVVTPSEIMTCVNLGLNVLKFFPAVEFGGLKTLKTYASVFKQVKFLPTGGINNKNLFEYLSEKNIIAVGGSYLANGNYEDITDAASKAISIVKEVKKHV